MQVPTSARRIDLDDEEEDVFTEGESADGLDADGGGLKLQDLAQAQGLGDHDPDADTQDLNEDAAEAATWQPRGPAEGASPSKGVGGNVGGRFAPPPPYAAKADPAEVAEVLLLGATSGLYHTV